MMSSANAYEWKKSQDDFNFIKGKLTFHNRAACAKKSNDPARSVFLIVDNVNIAKSVYRLAKIKKIDPVITTDLAIDKFRYTLTTLIKMIGQRLLSGDLPLVEDKLLSHEYLASHWSQSLNSSYKTLNNKIECKIVKKFSGLYSYLNVTKPDQFLLEKMAKDQLAIDESYIPCEDLNKREQTDVGLYQFDLDVHDQFKRMGFQFWYSLKVYLSWAYRYAPEVNQLSFPFDYLFKGVDLEEMILFFNNGCESLSPVECNENDLNLENLKMLTEVSESLDFSDLNLVRPFPESAVGPFFSGPLPLIDNDLLHLNDFERTEDWVNNFRKNFLKTRGYQKIRLQSAFSFLNLASTHLSSDKIHEDIHHESQMMDPIYKKEIFYLCSEYKLMTDSEYNLLGKDLIQLRSKTRLKEIYGEMFDNDLEAPFILLNELASKVSGLCNEFEEKKYWPNVLDINQDGFFPWYRQLTRQEKISFHDKAPLSLINPEKAYLKISDGDVICPTAIHCARKILDSMMMISAISKTISSLDTEGSILSANFSNPFSSQVACGVYDPWKKKNKIIYELFHDLAQTAIFSFLPTPVYVSADYDPKKLISFSSLMKEGKVFFEPKYDPKKIKLSLIADLGPLIGLPCAVSISGNRMNPFDYYSFNGISFSGCRHRTRSTTEAYSADDILTHSSSQGICGTCAINLSTISSSASLIHPAFRMSSFLLKGVLRLVNNLKDPHDLFRSWGLSPQQLALSYRYHGTISKKCGRKLLKGKSCLPKRCEAKVMEDFTKLYKVSPVSSAFSCFKNTGTLSIKECTTPIYLSFLNGLKVKTNCHLEMR